MWFKERLHNRWLDLRNAVFSTDTVSAMITGTAGLLKTPDAAPLGSAAARNFARWPINGYVWPQPPRKAGSFDASVQELLLWVQQRLVWMDYALASNNIAHIGTAAETACNPGAMPENPGCARLLNGKYNPFLSPDYENMGGIPDARSGRCTANKTALAQAATANPSAYPDWLVPTDECTLVRYINSQDCTVRDINRFPVRFAAVIRARFGPARPLLDPSSARSCDASTRVVVRSACQAR